MYVKKDTLLARFVKGLADGVNPEATLLPFDTQPGPQTRLLETEADEILYGGARGGGKSFGMLLDFGDHAITWGPSAKGILFRRQFVDLEDIIEESHRIYPAMSAKYSPGKQTWSFPNGAQLRFRYLARDSDANKYLGHQYTWMGVEEVGTYASFQTIRKLKATLRSSAGVKVCLHMNTNPGGVGHNWIKSRYVDAGPSETLVFEKDCPNKKCSYSVTWVDGEDEPMICPSKKCGSEYTGKETRSSRIYIPAKVEDNQILMKADPSYVSRIRASGPDWLVDAWLNGNWDIVAGGMFDDLFYPTVMESNIIVPGFEIPEHWMISRSFDHGTSKPFSVGWWVESDGTPVIFKNGNEHTFPRGSQIRVAEWYGCHPDRAEHANEGTGLVAHEIANGIINREMEMFGRLAAAGIADNGIWSNHGVRGQTVASEMLACGVQFRPYQKGQGTRANGWEVMRGRLKNAAELNDSPGLYIVETCADWIRTVPSLPRSERNNDDVNSDAEDHIADETRYHLTSPTFGFTAGTTRELWGRPRR